jgi:hypothetical protein
MAEIDEAFHKLSNQNKTFGNIEYFFTQRRVIEEQEYLDKNLNRKSKQINGNYTMYDAIDMNNTYGNDDNNINLGNSQIPAQNKAMQVKNLQFNDVKDLISETDIY